ncbi:MAG: sodium-dependent transporter [Paludibacteraceae bacterium]|nr:sodium-dependent transporter [Paludibacteraceae bacterium]
MQQRGNFSSKLGVILATAGSAVGLGNIWRFPYEAGSSGGGSFLLLYLLFVLLLGVPVILAEFVVGRSSQRNASAAFQVLAPNTPWHWVGKMGVLTGLLINGFYAVVTGWTFAYLFKSLTGGLMESGVDYQTLFDKMTSDTWAPIGWMLVVMLVAHTIIRKGVSGGIERASKILMPLLLVVMLVLSVHSCMLAGAPEGLKFLFYPDFSKITPTVAFRALGQAFFSLSLGMGCLITYSSYFKQDVDLQRSALQIALLDTLVAIIAGIIIFPAVFTFGVEPEAGPGLVFKVLPNVFAQMGYPFVWSSLFYLLLSIAALTSLISLHEVVTAYVSETWHVSRRWASWSVVGVVSVLGVFSSLSFGLLKDVQLFGRTFFDWLDFITSSVFLPLGGMLISIFVAWKLDRSRLENELAGKGRYAKAVLPFLIFILRYIAPVAIFVIFITSIIGA